MTLIETSSPPGKKLRKEIAALGLRESEAAASMGVTRQTVSNLINGRQQLSKQMAPKLDALTNKPTGYWMHVWHTPTTLQTVRMVGPGEHLKLEMKRLGLSQGEIGKAVGVSRQSINNIITGKNAISRKMAHKLGQLMELPSDYWMRNEYIEGPSSVMGGV